MTKKIIDKIEKTRSKNNKNWMDLLRIAFKYAPKQTSEVMKKINRCINKFLCWSQNYLIIEKVNA